MIHKCFAIFDSAAKAFLPPFHLPREEMAIRAFSDCVNSPSHNFATHSEDYTLFHIADFDDTTGEYKNLEPVNVNLGNGLRFKKQVNQDLVEEKAHGPFLGGTPTGNPPA